MRGLQVRVLPCQPKDNMKVETNAPISIIDVADANVLAVQQAQELAAIRNDAIRQAERTEKLEAWQDPDAMANRKMLNDRQAFLSLQALKAAGECELETPLPADSELPKHMRGQQPSTVRAWIRSSPEWHKRVREHRDAAVKKAERAVYLRKKYPEMYGLDDTDAREELAGKSVDDFAVRTGKQLKLSGDTSSPPAPGRIRSFLQRLRG